MVGGATRRKTGPGGPRTHFTGRWQCARVDRVLQLHEEGEGGKQRRQQREQRRYGESGRTQGTET